MNAVYDWLITGFWIAWMAYWFVAARFTKPTAREESVASRIAHITPLLLGIILLAAPHFPFAGLDHRFLPSGLTKFWIGATLVAGGLLWSVWARIYLGDNWSGTVTLKQEHALIRGGPYRFTRHPIYSGLLLAIFGSAIARGEWRGLVAFALVLFALRRKIVTEERFMTEQFPDDYPRYRAEVPALIPRPYFQPDK